VRDGCFVLQQAKLIEGPAKIGNPVVRCVQGMPCTACSRCGRHRHLAQFVEPLAQGGGYFRRWHRPQDDGAALFNLSLGFDPAREPIERGLRCDQLDPRDSFGTVGLALLEQRSVALCDSCGKLKIDLGRPGCEGVH
jgi:hypothetical protein